MVGLNATPMGLRVVILVLQLMLVCSVIRVGAIMGCFSNYVGVATSFEAKTLVVMKSIEIAYETGWCKHWIICDSALVVESYNSFGLIPLRVRNR